MSLKLTFMSRDLRSPISLGCILLWGALGQMPRVCPGVKVGIPRSSYLPRHPLMFARSLNSDRDLLCAKNCPRH